MNKIEELKSLIAEAQNLLGSSFGGFMSAKRYAITQDHISIFLKKHNETAVIINKETEIETEILDEQINKLNILLQKWQADGTFKFLPSKIISMYENGYYSESVFEAFKYIEVIVKRLTSFEGTAGVPLMRKAFDKDTGPLCNKNLPVEEREAMAHIFAGAVGFIRNPKAHNEIETGQQKAFELLNFANYLLRLLNGDFSKRK